MAKQPKKTTVAAQDDDRPDPKQVSSDYRAMQRYWRTVNAILHGVEALRMTAIRSQEGTMAVPGPAIPYASLSELNMNRRGRANAAVSPYLPQFPNETNRDYEIRRENAPLANIYKDISANLASKPFSKTLELDDKTPDDLKKLAQNVDGQGNNLHIFAADTFKSGIDKGIDWIWIDYNKIAGPVTLADERAMGARPYWVHIPAERMLAVYSDFLNGNEIFTHARIYEHAMQRDEFDEVSVERVRVLNREPIRPDDTVDADGNVIQGTGPITDYAPATWQLYELQASKDASGKQSQDWNVVDEGDITIGIIPLVPFKTGKRDGSSWRIDPPLKDLAYMQVEEFQQESNLKTIKEMTAFPMVAGQGVSPPEDTKTVVPVGPKAVLFAPPTMDGKTTGRWEWMEIGGASLNFLKSDLEAFRTEMRTLGMQPLATANLTVITTANVSMKAHNAVQAWALGLKDALEQAWLITCQWLGQKNAEITVHVHTDFGVDFEAGTELDALLKAEAQNILSKYTVRDEFQRRGVLRDDFDQTEEDTRLAKQQQGQVLQPELAIDPVTGQLVNPTSRPQLLSTALKAQQQGQQQKPPPTPTSNGKPPALQ